MPLRSKTARQFSILMRLMVIVWLLAASAYFGLIINAWGMALCVFLLCAFPTWEAWNLFNGKCNLCGSKLDVDNQH